MNKFIKKTVALTLVGASMFSLFACGDGGSTSDNGETGRYNDPYRKNTTHVIAVVQGGGIGDNWLKLAAERFAKEKYEHSYATGKQGVYIETKPVQGYNTAGLSGSADNMFILGRPIESLLSDDSVLDITEFVTDETREGGSLESKILPSAKAKCTDASGKYYALPHLEVYGGLNYDREVFDACNAYLAAPDATNKKEYQSDFSDLSAYMIGDASDKKSAGPDGAFNTEDDGLPASLEELLVLFDYIAEETDYAPIVYTSNYAYYTNYLLCGIWSALAGVEKMNNYYNVSGQIDVVKTDASGKLLFTDEDLFPGVDYIKKPQVETITLSESNAYRVTTMVEKYYAMATLEILEREGWFSSDAYKNTDHYGAQQAFIYQGKSNKYAKAAMLIEGTYWFNQATASGFFDDYEIYTGDSAANKDLRYMCLPTRIHDSDEVFVDESYGNTLLEVERSIAFLNSNLKDNDEVRQACLDFLAFLYTDAELAAFTQGTSMPIAMKYSLSNEQLADMTNFGRRIWDLRDNQNGSNMLYNCSVSPVYRLNFNEMCIVDGCDNFWTKFDAFGGIAGMNLSGYITALRQSKTKNPDGTYILGTQKLFVTNNQFQMSRFVRG